MSGPVRGIAAGIALVAAAVLPWVASSFAVSIATYALVVGLAALSAHVLAVAGQPTLDRAAYVGVGAYCAALASTWWGGWLVTQLLAAVLAGAAVAAVAGLAVSKSRAMVTLLVTFCIGELAVTTVAHWSVTGAGNGMSSNGFSLWPGWQPVTGAGPVYLCVLALAVACTIAVAALMASPTGLTLRAINANEGRAAASGYHVAARLWAAYLLAGVVAAAAGAALIMARRYVSPSDIGFEVSAAALAAALLGGRSAVLTVLIAGALIAIRDILGVQAPGYSPVLLGAVLILAAVTSGRARKDPA